MKFLRLCLVYLVLLSPLAASANSLRRAELLQILCGSYFEPRYLESFLDTAPIFIDVAPDDPLRGCIAAAYASGMIDGPPERRSFGAFALATPAQALKMITMFQRVDLQEFRSMGDHAWHAPYVAWAFRHGIRVTDPDAPLTTADLTELIAGVSRTPLSTFGVDFDAPSSIAPLQFGSQLLRWLYSSTMIKDGQ